MMPSNTLAVEWDALQVAAGPDDEPPSRSNGASAPKPLAAGLSAADPTTAAATAAAALVRLDGILFVADRPVALAELAQALETTRDGVERLLAELDAACQSRGVRLQRNNGHVQMVSAPEAAEAIQRFLGLEASARLSRAALESLSIIAYRQPLTRPEIDALRGVNSDGVLRTLLARGLVAPVGRRDTVGHPVEYGTTFQFLEYFGLGSLADLPPLADLVDPSDVDPNDLDPGDVEAGPIERGDVEAATDIDPSDVEPSVVAPGDSLAEDDRRDRPHA